MSQTKGSARADAFDGVNAASPAFHGVLTATSLIAACLVLLRRSPYLVSLAVGPLLAMVVYLAAYGLTDPAWHGIMALLTVGMFVSSLVTIAWVLIRVSINTFITSAVAEKISAITTEDYLAARAKKARKGGLKRVLDRVPKREPLPGDEL
ncbi:MAG: hypothetical protein RBS80_22605 [Thermoguttaceae bacterium]|nr:hypothetical protein [Thermoguttaceae bacterium]